MGRESAFRFEGGGPRGLKSFASVTAMLVLFGCSQPDNGLTKSDYRNLMTREPPIGANAGGPSRPEPPIPDLQPILATPPPPGLEQRLVSVNVPDPSVPVRDVLVELARKVNVDIDIDPRIQGGIIFTAHDRSFSEVIDRICDMANLRYSFENNVLKVQVDDMYQKDYKLDILNAVRTATTQVATSTDVFSSVQGGGGSSGSNNSSSAVNSTSTADPWTEIATNLKQILTLSDPRNYAYVSNVPGKQPEATGGGAEAAPAGGAAGAAKAAAGQAEATGQAGAEQGAAAQAAGGAAATGAQAAAGTQAAGGAAAGGTQAAGGAATGAQAAGGAAAGTQAAGGGISNPIAAAQQIANLTAQAANPDQNFGGGTGAGGGSTGGGGAAGGQKAATPAQSVSPQPQSIDVASYAINKSAGIVSVFGNSRQQKLVKAYLEQVLAKATNQVLIEAKVVEVTLSDQYKAGIDWQKVFNLAGATQTIGGNFITSVPSFPKQVLDATDANPFSLGWTGASLTALINFVQGFGTVRTLSSPRLTVMNNQTAVLKVAQNQVYFSLTATVTSTPSTTGAAPSQTATYSSQVHTVPIGVVMTVQPTIDPDTNQITMQLRPTVSVHNGDVADPAVSLSLASACAGSTTGPCSASSISQAVTNSLVPVVEVREMDSVVTVPSGDVVIMGGLMQETTTKQQTGVPGVQDVPLAGNLFKAQSDEGDLTELVIFLKATMVHGADSVDWADKDLYQRYMHDPRPLAF